MYRYVYTCCSFIIINLSIFSCVVFPLSLWWRARSGSLVHRNITSQWEDRRTQIARWRRASWGWTHGKGWTWPRHDILHYWTWLATPWHTSLLDTTGNAMTYFTDQYTYIWRCHETFLTGHYNSSERRRRCVINKHYYYAVISYALGLLTGLESLCWPCHDTQARILYVRERLNLITTDDCYWCNM